MGEKRAQDTAQVYDALRKVFGFQQFRPNGV
jgi:hypothetical protein